MEGNVTSAKVKISRVIPSMRDGSMLSNGLGYKRLMTLMCMNIELRHELTIPAINWAYCWKLHITWVRLLQARRNQSGLCVSEYSLKILRVSIEGHDAH
mgnify:CR=1 FL=1